ncbi:MAG: BatD family protein [Phycisphaeraceae bacterium]|nr:BatD family protein [Phycisphaerales bacterium]MCB9860453.1 BatD family protein [Phycisphaeraceae bacterium]
MSLCAALLGCVLPQIANAQDVDVAVRITTQEPVVGQSITLSVEVKNGTADTVPMLPEIDGLITQYNGESTSRMSSVQIINGKRQQTETTSTRYSYQITPLKPGEYQIPSLAFIVAGEKHDTPSFPLQVSMPQADPDYQLVLETDTTSAIVGQRVPMTLTWYVVLDRNKQISSNRTPAFVMMGPDGDYTTAALTPKPLPQNRGAGTIQVLFNGERITLEAEQVIHDNRAFFALRMPIVVLAESAGTHTIGPVTASLIVNEGGFFGNDRFVTIASNSLALNVRDLPDEGKPANYAGLVGRYTMEAEIDQISVHVGDPIALTLRVRGDEPMPRRIAPALELNTRFAQDFKLSPEGWEEAYENPTGVRIYTTTIRAANADVSEVPSIELPYFDIDSGQYRVARTQPIPITVEESAIVTLDDAVRHQPVPVENAPAKPAPSVEKQELTSSRVALGANVYDERALLHTTPAVLPFAWSSFAKPTVAMVVAGPPVLSACAVATVVLLRRRNPHRVLLHKAHAKAASLARSGKHADAVRSYVSCMTGIPTHSLTAGDCFAAIQSEQCDHAETLSSIVADDESARSSDAGDHKSKPAVASNQLRTMLDDLHANALKHATTRTGVAA